MDRAVIRRLIAWAALTSLAFGPAADAQFRSRAAPGFRPGLTYFVTAATENLGPELVTNGSFASASNWVVTGSGNISNGTFNATGADGDAQASTSVSLTSGSSYRITLSYVNNGDASASVSTPGGYVAIPTGSGSFSVSRTANTASFSPEIYGGSSGTGTYDNYSVRKVN